MKVCLRPGCNARGEPQPWSSFYARVRWPDGTVKNVQSYCKACDRVKRREWGRLHPEDNREHSNRASRKHLANPENLAKKRERDRTRVRRIHSIPPSRWRVVTPDPESGGPILPAEPFRRWLAAVRLPLSALAAQTGVPERRLGSVRNGAQAGVAMDVVDRVLLAVGDGTTLDDLYPLQEAA